MHTVVLGWFGASAVWFLPLLWRLVKSVLPGGAGLRGPGTIRLWLGFAGVLVASCTLEATLVRIADFNAFGQRLAGGLATLAGPVAPAVAMAVLFVAALPWLLDFHWRDLLAWADQSLGLGLGIEPGRDDDTPRSERRSRRAQAADAAPPQRVMSTSGMPARPGERRTRPTVWRPPATTRGAGAAAAAAGSAVAAGQTPHATAARRAEPALDGFRAASASEPGAAARPSRSAEPPGMMAAAQQRPAKPAAATPQPSRAPEPLIPMAMPSRAAAGAESARVEPVAPAGWLRSSSSGSRTQPAGGNAAGIDGRRPLSGGAESWRIDTVRGMTPSPTVTRPPLDAASSAVAAAAIAAQHGFTTSAAAQSLSPAGASRGRGGPPPVAGSTAARAAAAAPANRQPKPPRPFVWSPRRPLTAAQQTFGAPASSGGGSSVYPAPVATDGGHEPVSADIAATLRSIEENTARWTALASVSLARRSALERAELALGAAYDAVPAQADAAAQPAAAATDTHSAAIADVTDGADITANAPPTQALATHAPPVEPAAHLPDPPAAVRCAEAASPAAAFDPPTAAGHASPGPGFGGKPVDALSDAASSMDAMDAPEATSGRASPTPVPDAAAVVSNHGDFVAPPREVDAASLSVSIEPVAVAPAAADAMMNSTSAQADEPADEARQFASAAAAAGATAEVPHDAPARPAPAAENRGALAATPPWVAPAAQPAADQWTPSAAAVTSPSSDAFAPADEPALANRTVTAPPVEAPQTNRNATPIASAAATASAPADGAAPLSTTAATPSVQASASMPTPALTPTPTPTPTPTMMPTAVPPFAPEQASTSAQMAAPEPASARALPPLAATAAAAPAPSPASGPSVATEAPHARPDTPHTPATAPLPPVAAGLAGLAQSAPSPADANPDANPDADAPAGSPQRPVVRGHAPTTFEFRPPAASAVELPPLDLLERASSDMEPVSDEKLAQTGQLIEQRLQEFKVPVTVVGASAGPVITRFEIEPALGVRGSQIVGLMKDLSRGLGLTSIRVVETIPGKTCMGLELPNARRQMIRLSEILEAGQYQRSPSKLTIAMGKDIIGHPVVTDLAKAPHMLVAGTTGSGKSVAINAMILSLLYKATPEDVRLIMIDPKMLELSVYEGIPHLLAPVVTDMKLAANALNWCVGEMEKRYRLMSAVGVRNLAGFNQKIRDAQAHEKKIGNPFSLTPDDPEPLSTLPMIVVVIDELADLMMVAGKKIEELIARLAQKARAAGIHLILATQRPSVDVITGLIKANIPTRVAFQVSSKIDSRTILDQMGAESLLGQGDMLFLPPGTGYPQRVHGAFVADEEVHSVVEYLKQFGEPEYVEGILDGPATEGAPQDLFGEAPDAEADPLYDEAVAFVVRTRRASISSVQRQLRIGYNRAARLVEQMEAAGLVSPMGINGSREVLAPGPAE